MIALLPNLGGPDLIVIMIIIVVLAGIPAVIALPIIYILNRRRTKPPPLSPSVQQFSSNSPLDAPKEEL